MATVRDFDIRRLMPTGATGLHGTVESARSGTVYTIATDGHGVVSCSCIGWLHDSESKRPKGDPRPRRAIADRWCSHLRGIRYGTLNLRPRYQPTDDRAERLEAARAELAEIKREMDRCWYIVEHIDPEAHIVIAAARTRLAELREQVLGYSELVGYAATDALVGGEP